MTGLSEEIIPTAIIIMNIPFDWTKGHVLHLMSQMKLPLPSVFNYLYDNFHRFRCMAFATFRSSEEARQVVQRLHGQCTYGTRLNVQYKRKRPETMASDTCSPRVNFHPNQYSHSEAREKTYSYPQTKVPSTPTPAREQTPSKESYDLLMQYQTEPVEQAKLRKFLARTGDYQEAVNEFAKNRVRETEEGGYLTSMEIPPILEMRPATPGEVEQIAEMESWFGLGGEAPSRGSLSLPNAGGRDAINATNKGSLESINPASIQTEHEGTLTKQGRVLDKGKDKEHVEKGRVQDCDKIHQGIDHEPKRIGDEPGSKKSLSMG